MLVRPPCIERHKIGVVLCQIERKTPTVTLPPVVRIGSPTSGIVEVGEGEWSPHILGRNLVGNAPPRVWSHPHPLRITRRVPENTFVQDEESLVRANPMNPRRPTRTVQPGPGRHCAMLFTPLRIFIGTVWSYRWGGEITIVAARQVTEKAGTWHRRRKSASENLVRGQNARNKGNSSSGRRPRSPSRPVDARGGTNIRKWYRRSCMIGTSRSPVARMLLRFLRNRLVRISV